MTVPEHNSWTAQFFWWWGRGWMHDVLWRRLSIAAVQYGYVSVQYGYVSEFVYGWHRGPWPPPAVRS